MGVNPVRKVRFRGNLSIKYKWEQLLYRSYKEFAPIRKGAGALPHGEAGLSKGVKRQRLNQKRIKKSEFQKKVYQVVKKIAPGKTMTYKEVAEAVGSPQAWRAVGNVLNKNSDPEIPCHRVIRADGKIGGYNKGVKKKILILRKEARLHNKFQSLQR